MELGLQGGQRGSLAAISTGPGRQTLPCEPMSCVHGMNMHVHVGPAEV
jgi:hypothetical protein